MFRFKSFTGMLSIALAIFAISMGWGNPAYAQAQETDTTAAIPQQLTKDQVDELVARLSDEDARELLIRQLDKVAEPDPPAETSQAVIDRFVNYLKSAEFRITEVLSVMGQVPQVPVELWRGIAAGSESSVWGVLLHILIFFAVGIFAERMFQRLVTTLSINTQPRFRPSFVTRLKMSALRSIAELISIFVFILGSLLAWLVSELPTENARAFFTSLLSAVLVWRLCNLAFRFLLSPDHPRYRIFDISDDAAARIYFWLRFIAGILIFILLWSKELMLAFDIPTTIISASTLITSAIFIGSVIILILNVKSSAAEDTDSAPDRDYLVRNWHILAILGTLLIYILALGVNFATGVSVLVPTIASLVLLGLVPVIDVGLRNAVHQFMGAGVDNDSETVPQEESVDVDEAAEPAPKAPPAEHTPDSQTYEAVVVSNLRILLFIFSILIFAEIWDLNLFGILIALFGEATTKVLVNFSVTALLAYALWSIVSAAVARVAGPDIEGGGKQGDEGGGGGGSRLVTVLPLLKKFLFITLIVMLTMILLSSLGVDIGPLIAGAGILGIAIGFGAQTLVKDIVSGLFFLLDDAFRVGEYVTIGDTKGTVEKISVRSLRLRHHNGPLHTVPFGEIQTLTNWSRDWAIMKFEIRVPFETDVDMVRRMIKKVGIAMLDDPELGPLFLEPLKSQGVNRMDDSSFIIRCKFTCTPGNQFYIRREAYARIQAAFESKGIKFAPRRVIVETTSPANAQVAAAGAAAIDNPDEHQSQGKDEPG